MLNGYVRLSADVNQVGTSGVEPHDGVLDSEDRKRWSGKWCWSSPRRSPTTSWAFSTA